jgi:hypothetical protein
MTVKITKPSINVREKLSELDKETGIKGEELLRADTSAEAREALQLDEQLFTDFESTGIDDNATSTAVTIDSSSNLLVGKTAATSTTAGAELKNGVDNSAIIGTSTLTSANSGSVSILNRLTTDGDIVQFRKDGTTVGSIGAFSGNAYFGNGDTGIRPNAATDAIYPISVTAGGSSRTNAISLGDSGTKFKDAHFSGTVNANAFVGDGSGLTGVGGGAWELLNTITASNVATLNITGLNTSYTDYEVFNIVIKNFSASSNSTNLLGRLMFGTSTTATTSAIYNSVRHGASSSNGAWGGTYEDDQSSFRLILPPVNTIAANAGHTLTLDVRVNQGETGVIPSIKTNYSMIYENDISYGFSAAFFRDSSSTYSKINGIQLFMSSGNIYLADVYIYGLKKS